MSNPLMDRTVRQGFNAQNVQTPTAEQLNSMYMAPSAPAGGRNTVAPERTMTYDDVYMKSLLSFAVLLVGAAVGWFVPLLALPAALIALVLGLVNAFKREPVPALVLAFAVFEGAFVGGVSRIFENQFEGIVLQAVIGTLSVFALMFVLFKFRVIRMTAKFNKFLMLAVGGYAIFSLVNFAFAMFSGGSMNARTMEISILGINMPLGVLISGIAVVLAALTVVSDFDMIEKGVGRIPAKFAWMCAFSLMSSLVWLYIEILRLLSYFRD